MAIKDSPWKKTVGDLYLTFYFCTDRHGQH